MKYFAYGSNMLEERLTNRVPDATFLTIAAIRGYKLYFHKRSDDGSGKCSIVRTDSREDMVYGVVFEVPDNQLEALDKAEGVGHGYRHNYKIPIRLADGTKLPMLTYVATGLKFIDDSLIPYVWYHALVIAGAEQHNLPEDYIAGLQAVSCSTDPKPNRRTKLEAEEALEAYRSKMRS